MPCSRKRAVFIGLVRSDYCSGVYKVAPQPSREHSVAERPLSRKHYPSSPTVISLFMLAAGNVEMRYDFHKGTRNLKYSFTGTTCKMAEVLMEVSRYFVSSIEQVGYAILVPRVNHGNF
jgi:hypothetical protein